ncbi:S-adenosyl-L-methionine-dependent methyltransferase [Westerdykella ornata]|uniref:S-adenosyl-L-methionine-dependent methyltransferase n=1 Tax=Westerdykella ornata TaxID=318751 RepID=A0A6A6JPH7_WESOR|nr:S-adenosyl-L-methionine-dependent methyltransferase [Westerdykella ornata]KAF2278155.1 S-adenosyl-L-methionine-dependent methyltransferase [Westerdykella ornata]
MRHFSLTQIAVSRQQRSLIPQKKSYSTFHHQFSIVPFFRASVLSSVPTRLTLAHSSHPHDLHPYRPFSTTHAMSSPSPSSSQNPTPIRKEKEKDTWFPSQYLTFATPRLQPVHDLLARIHPHIRVSPTHLRIFDLGCGPGTSTAALVDAFPGARMTGVDSSANMLDEARRRFASLGVQGVDWVHADLNTWTLPMPESKSEPRSQQQGDDSQQQQTLLFSNATLHWLRSPSRHALLTRLLSSPSLAPGSILAFQVPDNYHAPTHSLMRETALLPSQPWTPFFDSSSGGAKIGDLKSDQRPDLDPIEKSATYIRWMEDAGAKKGEVQVWRTEYMHIVLGARDIVEWVGSTGLRPYLDRITEEGARRAFLNEYERRVGEVYAAEGSEWRVDGERCVLGYPRLFVVGVKG